jgi:ribonuclease Z
MEKITVLGSANAIAKPDQQNTHMLIETDTRKIMVDCGNHPVGNLAGVNVAINDLTDLILTHFHADHVGSLPLLIMDMWLEKRTAPLAVYGLDVTLDKAKQLLDLFGWQNWPGMYPVHFIAIPESGLDGFIQDQEVKLTALPVEHLIPTIGIRIEFASGRVVAYSCDTEPCENVLKLARRADVLLQESAGQSKGHTSAAQAGMLSSQAGVKRLVLIHYDGRLGEKSLLAEARTTFGGEIELAKDGLVI